MAQPLGLLEPVRGEKDRHPPLAQRADQLVDLVTRNRIQARRRLIEEQHRRVVEQRPRERDPLTQALRQRPARIVRAVGEVDRPQCSVDAPADIV